MKARLAYLCLQATRQGQASHAHVNEIVAGLERLGWTVELFEPRHGGGGFIDSVAGRLLGALGAQIRLSRRLGAVDLLYVRTHPLALPTALVARLRRIPRIEEVNGPYGDIFVAYPWLAPVGVVLRAAMRFILKSADALIVVTPELREWLLGELGPRPVCVVSNGANVDVFHPGAKFSRSLPQPYVVFFGAFARWQGLETLLAAVELPEWPRDLNLIIAGQGAERARVEAAATRHRLVSYLGVVPYAEVPGLVAQAIASLVPKNRPGERPGVGWSPLKLFESMACGTPAVVSDLPGQAEVVRASGAGLVIPPEDPLALALAAAYILEHPAERADMGRRGREAAVRDHAWDIKARETEAVIANVLAGRARRA